MSDVANTDKQRNFTLNLKKTQPGRTCLMAARPGLWDQLTPKRITASQQTLHWQLHRRRRSQRQPDQQRQRQRHPQPARRPEEEQRPGQEPRSCCRQASASMQGKGRAEQVWSSSIDNPKILKVKNLGRACCFWA